MFYNQDDFIMQVTRTSALVKLERGWGPGPNKTNKKDDYKKKHKQNEDALQKTVSFFQFRSLCT